MIEKEKALEWKFTFGSAARWFARLDVNGVRQKFDIWLECDSAGCVTFGLYVNEQRVEMCGTLQSAQSAGDRWLKSKTDAS